MTFRAAGWVRGRARDPVFWNGVTQLAKTVLAAVLAWWLATSLLDLPQSFLAPWSALLVVHATVYRTFAQGARQVGAAVLGVVVAWAVGNLLGVDPLAVAVTLVVGLSLGSLPWLRDQGTTLAATALVVVTTGFSDDDSMLLSRLADTGIGIAVGLVVTALVWPPLRRRTTIAALDGLDDRLGGLLVEIADGVEAGVPADDVEEWIDRTRDLDDELDRAWALVRQAKESARMNPRRSADELKDPRRWVELLRRVEQALAETRSMVRTLSYVEDGADGGTWVPAVRDAYAGVLREGGDAIARADREDIEAARRGLERLADTVGALTPVPALWPVYGGLVVNLRNILDAMADVADANPMTQPPLPLSGLRRRHR